MSSPFSGCISSARRKTVRRFAGVEGAAFSDLIDKE
jgi:hypothetical protein